MPERPNVARAEVFEVELPLVRPFAAAHGEMTHRHAVLIRIEDRDGAEGWGECGADLTRYSFPETPATAWNDLVERLVPALWDPPGEPSATGPMAHAALAAALEDLAARQADQPLAVWWGGSVRSIPVGAVVGLASGRGSLLGEAARYLEDGYRRIKVKIQPGWDVEPIRWLREEWPEVTLAADANGSYHPQDSAHLLALDTFELDFIEQPFGVTEFEEHARLSARLETPLCLDESITSPADVARAVEAGSAQLIAVKAARLGGARQAIAVHDACLRAGIRPWVGGLLETGVGRAHAVALATLPGFVEPADLSASERYFVDDIVSPPWQLEDGELKPSGKPGIGCAIRPDILADHTARRTTIRPGLGRR